MPALRPRRRGRRRRVVIGAFLAIAAIASVLAWQPVPLLRALARATPGIVWCVETRQPVAALTFDDGPDPAHTPQVLDLLRHRGVRATFFIIGAHAHAHPALLERIRGEGHEIANHWIRRGKTVHLSDALFLEGLVRTETLIGQVPPLLFRPPGGIIRPSHRRLAEARGHRLVLGSAYPYDPQRPPVGYIRWLIRKNIDPGGIVILHDGGTDQSGTVAALPGVLDDARASGLRFVTVSELLALRASAE